MTTPRLALITIVATLAYLGLAILGWGRFAAFFSHSALIALTIVLFALSGVAIFSGGNLSRGVREDRANRWVIVAFGLIGVLAAYLPAYTDRKGFWTVYGDAIRWLGVVLFAAGGALRIWPVFVLGHRFSGLVAIQPGHKLVTSGVYGVIRHPSYLGLLVNSLGWALAFRSGVVKAGIDVMTKSLARTLAPEVRVLAVFPGVVDTAFVPGRGADFNEKVAAAAPLKRIGRPEEIAAAILACATHLTFSTGTTILADGGLFAVIPRERCALAFPRGRA